jgi:non-ribosomal peptide synthetase component F/SAM-dependent methyltransferase
MNRAIPARAERDHAAEFDDLAAEYAGALEPDVDDGALTGLRELAAGGLVLDVGCGSGALVVGLAGSARRVVGLDLSEEMIAAARVRAQGAGNVDFLAGDLEALPFERESFDMVVSTYALHHVEQAAGLVRLKALVKPGGWLYVRDPVLPDGLRSREWHHRWEGARYAQRMLRDRGVAAAWRALRFTQSGEWIRHVSSDAFWTEGDARRQYAELLPGGTVQGGRGTLSVLWQKPRAAAVQAEGAAEIRPLRTYSGRVPASYAGFPREAIEGSVPARFEEIVRRYGAREAVRTKHESLTYAELNARANGVARRVLAECATGRAVAMLMDQDDMFAPAMLGILKAGCAYVALDPSDPAERWERILTQVDASVVITTAVRAQELRLPSGVRVLVAEEIGADEENLNIAIGPDALAAMFFTSGSTGEPKGSARDHRLFLHTTWMHTTTNFVSPEDRITLLFFLGFGASMWSIFDALLNGATLCSINPRGVDPRAVIEWMQREGITQLNPSVTLYRSLAETAIEEQAKFPALRLGALGGQTLYGKDIRTFRAAFGVDAVLLFELGSTETGLMTQGYFDAHTPVSDGVVSVGYTVADKELLIVDEDGAEVAAGEYGLLAVRSRYLSLDVGRDEKQAEQHAGNLAGARVFRTSDRARLRADGCLEIAGRQDSIVKVRGYRVDLAAIETVLNAHLDVRNSAVVARADESGERRVDAYVEWKGARRFRVDEMREYLAGRLPMYMVPARMAAVEKLPLGASGKLDRSALPAIGGARPELREAYIAPRTETERMIAEIWAEVLQLERVGVNDRFGDLGGDSILAALVGVRVAKALALLGELSELLRFETVAGMAAWFEGRVEAPVQISVQRNWSRQPELKSKLAKLWWNGPILKGHALPYPLGHALEKVWLKLPMNRAALRQQAAPLYEWMRLMSIDENSAQGRDLVERSFWANTWPRWRVHVALEWLKDSRSIIEVHGEEHLLSALQAKRGVMLVGNHFGFSFGRPVQIMMARYGREVAGNTFGMPIHTAADQSQWISRWPDLIAALQDGKVVLAAGDGRFGVGGLTIPLHGIPFQVRTGTARLVVESGAVMIPLKMELIPGYRLKVELHAPIRPEDCSAELHAEPVEWMTRRYGEYMQKHWGSLLGVMAWWKLQQILDMARDEDVGV